MRRALAKWVSGISGGFLSTRTTLHIIWTIFELPDHVGTGSAWANLLFGWSESDEDDENGVTLDVLLLCVGIGLLLYATSSWWYQRLRDWYAEWCIQPTAKERREFRQLHVMVKTSMNLLRTWQQGLDPTYTTREDQLTDMVTLFGYLCDWLEHLNVWTPSTLIADFDEGVWYRYRGILKKCVNDQAVYPLSEHNGLGGP